MPGWGWQDEANARAEFIETDNTGMRIDPEYRRAPKRTFASVFGEAPNGSGRHRYDTQSGKRLRKMMGAELPWYNVFDQLPERWSVKDARERVDAWIELHGHEGEPLLLLGVKVCEAFRLPHDFEWLEWYRDPRHRHPMVTIPHTSPRNTWWNVPENREAGAQLLTAIANGLLPREERGKDAKRNAKEELL